MQVSLKTLHSKCSINVEWMLFIMSRMCCISCQLLYKSLDLWVKATLICLHGFSVDLTWSHWCDCGLLAVWLGIRGSYIALFMCLAPQLEQLEWPILSLVVIFHLCSFTWWWASPKEWVLLKPPWCHICWYSLDQIRSRGQAQSQCGKGLYRSLDARTHGSLGATNVIIQDVYLSPWSSF